MKVVIVGGGISGLSLAYFLLEKNPGIDVSVLESDKQPGGKIWTDRTDGFLCEGGVNGFLDNRPRTLELVSKLALTPLRSNDAARKRYLYSDRKLHLLPESPAAFFASNLLSLYGRFRIVCEMFVPKGTRDDETLAEFARRRLGREAFEKLIDPMASGIYAGDPEKMSLKSCFRKVYDLEMKYGSLIRGMLQLKKEAKKTGKKVGAGPGGVLTSFYDGMGSLIQSLAHHLGSRLSVNSKAVSIEKSRDNYVVTLSDNTSFGADIVVLSSPAHATAEMVSGLDSGLARLLRDIPYPCISVVCVGYRKDRIKQSDGFGFLVPGREGRKILGTLWDSNIFPNRAPDGYVLFRSMLGGARASELAMKDDELLTDIVAGELRDIMDITVQPDFVRVYRHEKGIPQYLRDHGKRLENIYGILRKYPGLHLSGNSYQGIGVNDCIENSHKLAEKIASGI